MYHHRFIDNFPMPPIRTPIINRVSTLFANHDAAWRLESRGSQITAMAPKLVVDYTSCDSCSGASHTSVFFMTTHVLTNWISRTIDQSMLCTLTVHTAQPNLASTISKAAGYSNRAYKCRFAMISKWAIIYYCVQLYCTSC